MKYNTLGKFVNILYLINGFLFLFFMLAFPSVFQEVKYIAMFILLLLGTIELILKQKKFKITFIFSILVWYSYFIFSLFIGINNNFPMNDTSVNIYFITPIVAIILSSIVCNNYRFIYLNKILILITFLICLIDIIYILNINNVINLPFEINSPIFGSAKLLENIIEFRITNQSSLMFLLPYLIAIYYSGGYDTNLEKIFMLTTIIMGIIVVIMSGRRALELIVLISFILTFYLIYVKIDFHALKSKAKLLQVFLYFIFIFIILTIITMNFFNSMEEFQTFFQIVYKTFMNAFDPSQSSSQVRIDQSIALTEGWTKSLFIGHGVNSYVIDLIRNSRDPVSYEMVYLALLFQTGIVGFILFFLFSFLIIINLYNKIGRFEQIENNYFFGILIGFSCFIIAGSSNPLVYYVWAWAFALIGFQKSIILEKQV